MLIRYDLAYIYDWPYARFNIKLATGYGVVFIKMHTVCAKLMGLLL